MLPEHVMPLELKVFPQFYFLRFP